MVRATRGLWLLLAVAGVGCGEPEDDPTQVRDLRVLGMRLDAPELLAPSCDFQSPATFLAWAQPVTLTALIADPQGGGREIAWDLRACAWQSDRKCEGANDSLVVASGTTGPGELAIPLAPGQLTLPDRDNQPLLLQVQQQDTFKGLGGIRMPLVLHLTAGGEEIFAMKLMVFSCAWFPEMRANAQPALPGIVFEGVDWPALSPDGSRVQLRGTGPFQMEPADFSALEESYVVPSYSLEPVQLTESWKVTWMATAGRFSSYETGGTDLDGVTGRQNVSWAPPRDYAEQDITFTFVVRDGRGGESWLSRTVHYARR